MTVAPAQVETGPRARLQARVSELVGARHPVRVLDAGCGHRLPIPIADDLHVVGIDLDATQLRSGLDEAIVGDLVASYLGHERFDAIVCWNVLEHVAYPPIVLARFADALAPGGVAILGLPHAASVKGLVTKFTPQPVHAWAWRRLFGGGSDHEEFETVMAWTLRPAGLRRLAASLGLTVEMLEEYESWTQRRIRGRLGLTGRRFRVLSWLVRTATLGQVVLDRTDLVALLRRAV
ncbi:MAG: class I SAM-dependent methyltransferase [Sciscionella sp.]